MPCQLRLRGQVLSSGDSPRNRGCRRGTSVTGGERKYAFPNSLSREKQRLANVVGVEIRIERENLVRRLALSDESHNRRDRNPKPAQARDASPFGGDWS